MFSPSLGRLLMTCGVALLPIAGWLWWQHQSQREPYVEQDQQVFQNAVVGITHRSTFRLHNPRSNSIRFVGMELTCGHNFCFGAEQVELVVVPPGQSTVVPFTFEVKSAGPFMDKYRIFLEVEGVLREIVVKVQGTGKQP